MKILKLTEKDFHYEGDTEIMNSKKMKESFRSDIVCIKTDDKLKIYKTSFVEIPRNSVFTETEFVEKLKTIDIEHNNFLKIGRAHV